MSNLLSLITFIPLVAAVILALLARGDGEASQRNVKYLALAATGFTFLASLMLLSGFEPNDTGFQFVEERSWLLGMQYKMGVDGISLLFVLLTSMSATAKSKPERVYLLSSNAFATSGRVEGLTIAIALLV